LRSLNRLRILHTIGTPGDQVVTVDGEQERDAVEDLGPRVLKSGATFADASWSLGLVAVAV
jgi:hypothetical protein